MIFFAQPSPTELFQTVCKSVIFFSFESFSVILQQLLALPAGQTTEFQFRIGLVFESAVKTKQ